MSQADTGTMIALTPDERLHELSRTGAVLADFPTMVSDGPAVSGPVSKFAGPFEPQISPDGSKVAFEWFNDSYEETPGCSATSSPPCAVYAQRQGVAVTHADRLTGPEDFGLMTGWIYPQWIGEDTLVRSESGKVLNDDAVLTPVGGEADPWMYDDQQGYGVADVELSRDQRTVVGIAGDADQELRIYRTLTDPFDTPDWNHSPFAQGNVPAVERCDSITGATFTSPSLSPDGRGLAFGTPGGIGVVALDGCALAGEAKLIVPGVTHADWGPTDVPEAGATGPQPAPTAAPAPTAGPDATASARLTAARAKRRHGRVVVRVRGETTASAQVVVRARRARASRPVAAGAFSARLRLRTRARRVVVTVADARRVVRVR